MHSLDTKAVLLVVMMLVAASIATGLSIGAGATWPAALLAGGGAALGVAMAIPPLMK